MKFSKLVISLISFLYILTSCSENNYEILNNFSATNNIKTTNLQQEFFCFKELNLTKAEEKSLNLLITNDKCNTIKKINIDKINFNRQEANNSIKSRISLPLYSIDKNYIYIVIQEFETNKAHFYRIETLYKLSKKDNKWIIVDSYKTITQS